MSVVLQIIGGIVVLGILLLILAFLVLRWKLKRIVKDFGNLADGGNFVGGPPLRVRLTPTQSSSWDESAVLEPVTVFDQIGYSRVSAYRTPEIPGLTLLPFVAPNQDAYAVVYQHQVMGVWVDLWTRYADGTTLTVTSAARGGELEHRPGNEKAYLPGTPASQIHEVFLSKLNPDKPKTSATIEGFARDFEKSYEDEMAWRSSKGYSDDEIRAVAALDGGYDEDTIEQTRESMNAQAAEQLTEVLKRRYMESSGLSAADWEDQRERIVIVHDKRKTEDILEEVSYYVELEEALYEGAEASDLSPREFMDWLNDALVYDQQFKKLRTLHEPVEADVWLAPSESN